MTDNKNTSFSYFAADGSYGNAEKMVIVYTSDWTDEMWNTIHESSDSDRAYIAQCFEEGVPINGTR